MIVEVCAYSLSSCITAQKARAGRIELCGGLSEGGTTPSAGLIQLAKQSLTIPVIVMIRPRGGDFLYSSSELAVMRADISMAKMLGADGVVLGILNADGTVDEAQTRQLVDLANPMPVTFHRAFDMTSDPFDALESIINTGAVRILTSGQQPTAEKGAALLRKLAGLAGNRIEIMAGAGVYEGNTNLLMQTGVKALHLSGSKKEDSPMTFRQPAVSMASTSVGEYEHVEADENKIRAVIKQLAS